MGIPRERMELSLELRRGVVASVNLASGRATEASRVLVGRSVDDALHVVPLLFALCGRAQSEAACGALDQASGRIPSKAERAARELLVATEAVDQHLQAILLGWPQAMGSAPDMASYVELRRAVGQVPTLLHPAGLSMRAAPRPILPDVEGLDAVLARLGAEVGRLAPDGLDDARAFANPTGAPSQVVLHHVLDEGLDEVGAGADIGWGAPDPAFIDRALGEDANAFSALPVAADGGVLEVGPLAMVRGHPAVEAAIARSGAGVLARLVSRLVALKVHHRAALEAVERLGADPDAEATAYRSGTGVGLGVAETARGPLHHRVEIDRGTVVGWSSVAPTEWNLHPRGALSTLVGRPAARAEAAARWLLLSLDPCVPAEVRVTEGPD